jgi:DNA-binding response OmpR family regulator
MLTHRFTPPVPAVPHAFVNREREVELIYDHLTARRGGHVALHGPLGIGKTSLLQFLADPAVAGDYGIGEPRYATVHVDMQSITRFSSTRFWQRTLRLAQRLPVADLEAITSPLLSRESVEMLALEDLLDALEQRHQTLVLLLDEFEWALQAGTPQERAASRGFLAQLGALMRRSPQAIAVVTATEQPLAHAVTAVDPANGPRFAALFTPVGLTPLTRSDMDRLLDHLLGDGTFRLDEAHRTALYSLSGGQPAAVQSAAFSVLYGLQHPDRLVAAATAAPMAALGRHNGQLAATWAPSAAPDRSWTNDHTAPAEARRGNGSRRGLWMDPANGEVVVEGRFTRDLTALECHLLRILYAQPRQVFEKAELLQAVWGDAAREAASNARLEKLVSRVRQKVEPVPARPRYLRTVRGRGYRLDP